MASEEISGTIAFSIVTPTGLVEETTTGQVTLSGVEGDFGALPGHAPFFTQLRPGVIYYDEGGMPRTLFASGGFVEVNPDRVIVLAESCLNKDEIDKESVIKEKEEAELKLAELAPDDEERNEAVKQLDAATVKLQFVSGELDLY